MAAGLRAKLEMWELDAWRKVERDDEQVSRALDRYAGWLEEWRRALEDREAAARDQLEDFEAVPGMEGILKIWKGLAKEARAVREMVRRLDEAEGGRTLPMGRTT
jgi:DNA-binding SARP family transcriptional activator